MDEKIVCGNEWIGIIEESRINFSLNGILLDVVLYSLICYAMRCKRIFKDDLNTNTIRLTALALKEQDFFS